MKISLRKRKILAAIIILLESDLEMDSEEDNVCVTVGTAMQKKKRRVTMHNFEEAVANYNPDDFHQHFHLSRTTFDIILNELSPLLALEPSLKRGPDIDIEKQVLITLWMLANQESHRTVAERFNVTIFMTWKYFHKVVDAFNAIASKIITWPKCETERKLIAAAFYINNGIKGVIGAIDHTHIPICKPHQNPNAYLNSNGYFTIQVQAVCDANHKFIDCYMDSPGSVPVTSVFCLSPLGDKLSTNQQEFIPSEYHLLGDSCYPNCTYLITPYEENGGLEGVEKCFNDKHSSTRFVIEEAFGMLKGRFSILKYINIYDTKRIPKIILACCVIHNYCINLNDVNVVLYKEENNVNECGANLTTEDGKIKRNQLANELK